MPKINRPAFTLKPAAPIIGVPFRSSAVDTIGHRKLPITQPTAKLFKGK
jgi:hypothetical protein